MHNSDGVPAGLRVCPPDALVDEPTSFIVGGLTPSTRVVLRARGRRTGPWFESSAEFEVGPDGSVDTARDPSLAGSYVGVEAEGLLWSLRSDGTARRSEGATDPWTVDVSAEANGDLVASTSTTRHYLGNGVTTTTISEEGFRGRLFQPSDTDDVTPVIAFAGGAGGMLVDWAAVLASRGLPTLAIAYFGYEDLPSHQTEVPLEYFDTAIDRVRELTGADRVSCIGISWGALTSLLMGSRNPAVAGVVAVNGCGWVCQAKNASGGVSSPFSLSGKPLPFAGPLAPPEMAPHARIPVEQIDGPVLLVSGGKDATWTSTPLAVDVVSRLADHPHEVRHLDYPEAGHLIGIANAPHTSQTWEFDDGYRLAMGGAPAPDAHASADAWPQIVDFLRSVT